MPGNKFNTPILFIVFNRPETTKRVFAAIREAKPSKLYVAADGPRTDNADEHTRIQEVRKIATTVDWDCEVSTLFREQNIGCKMAVSSAITWFFEHEEEGIILEDDCLPNQSFFHYCQDLLKKYRNDQRIWLIAGYNPLGQYPTLNKESYIFSGYGGIWGWATWKRCWSYYDFFCSNWKLALKNRSMRWVCSNEEEYKFWEQKCIKVFNGEIDTWDYQWAWTRRSFHGLSIVPSKNMISNIGFSEGATHTKKTCHLGETLTFEILLPLRHPYFICQNREYDSLHGINVYYGKTKHSFIGNILNHIKNITI